MNREIRVDVFSKEYSWLKDPEYLSSLKHLQSDCCFDIPKLVGLSGLSGMPLKSPKCLWSQTEEFHHVDVSISVHLTLFFLYLSPWQFWGLNPKLGKYSATYLYPQFRTSFSKYFEIDIYI